jgi:predicted membrane protein
MENKGDNSKENLIKNFEAEHKRGKILGGLLVVVIGVVFLAKELGAEIPVWLFNWKMLLIGVGLVTLLKHKFRNGWGAVLMLVGGAFLVIDLYPELEIKSLILPVLIILVGLFIIFKPRRKFHRHHWNKWEKHYQYNKNWAIHGNSCQEEEVSSDDVINTHVKMGGLKKSIVSKTFKGGLVKIMFGGVELNLSQADFEKEAVLEIDQLFGGLELIVPAHWEVRSEMATGFSSIEDNRTVHPSPSGETPKVLILKGSNYFGGIEIKNY